VQTRKTNIARLGESRPKTKVANTILAVLQQEAQPLPIGKIVRSVAARLDGINPHSIYTRVYKLAEEQRIDSIDRDGTRYYAHHGIITPEQQPARDTRSAIIDILSAAKEPMLLEELAKSVRDQRGIAKKNAYVAIARLVSDGLAKEHVIFRRRHVALAHPAPVVEEQSRHIPAAEPAPPALPDTPHFIDCELRIGGLDITARITIDLPNTIAREATFRYLVRVLGELERISSDVLGIGAALSQAQSAMQLAEEEEVKRRRLEQRIALISAALLPEEPASDQ
jgi:Fe2+ or Zn2+ uptake regulation protein